MNRRVIFVLAPLVVLGFFLVFYARQRQLTYQSSRIDADMKRLEAIAIAQHTHQASESYTTYDGRFTITYYESALAVPLYLIEDNQTHRQYLAVEHMGIVDLNYGHQP
jgi:hypothetical protein